MARGSETEKKKKKCMCSLFIRARRDVTQYTSSCKGYAASTAGCTELKEAMEQAEDSINVLLHLPFVYYVQGSGGSLCITARIA